MNRHQRYDRTAKGRARHHRYNQSAKGQRRSFYGNLRDAQRRHAQRWSMLLAKNIHDPMSEGESGARVLSEGVEAPTERRATMDDASRTCYGVEVESAPYPVLEG